MTDKRNNLDRLFAAARAETPVVTFGETRAHVEAATNGRPAKASDETLQPNKQIHGSTIMITTGIGIITAGLIGFLAWNTDAADRKNGEGPATETNRPAAVNAAPLAAPAAKPELKGAKEDVRSAELHGATAATIKNEGKKVAAAGKDEKNEEGAAPAGDNVTFGLRMLELTTEELGRLGLQPDTAGVWIFRNDGGLRSGYQVGMWGLQMPSQPDVFRKAGTVYSTLQPVFITDDLGNRRVEWQDDASETERREAIANRIREIEQERGAPLSDEERFKLELELEAEFADRRLADGNFVPVLVRTGHPYTEADKAARRWRPDCIFWYEPTAEFRAALPEYARLQLERELRLVSVFRGKPHHESMDAFLERQPLEIRRGFDSLMTGERTKQAIEMIAGESYTGVLATASGALTSSSVMPNPATGHTVVHYTLGTSREVSLALYDVRGGLVRLLNKGEMQSAGEHDMRIELDDVAAGIYLVVISTGKENAVQRVIVAE